MAQITLQTEEKSRLQAVNGTTSRLVFIDHLRAALIILVVLHHVASVYGGVPFYYMEPPFTDPLAFLILLTFTLLNQAWFMGALFLIAGYFTPGSYDRKGSGSFLKGRLLRLGIPLLVYISVLNPLSAVGYWQMPVSLTGITSPLSWGLYPFLIGLGIAWFIALLLIFNFGYAAWRKLVGDRAFSWPSESSAPGYLGIAIFVLALALASYLLRMVIPIGRELFDFPTLSYLSQYLSFFVLGALAYRRDWLRTLLGSMGVVGFVAAVSATIILFPLALSGRLFALEVAEPANWAGNGTWQSAVYALWDAIFAAGMCLAAITFFRRYFNEKSRLGNFLSQQSYAVYLIHVPIIVFLAVAIKDFDLGPLLKFVLLSIIVIPTCFILAYAIRKIPGVSRIL